MEDTGQYWFGRKYGRICHVKCVILKDKTGHSGGQAAFNTGVRVQALICVIICQISAGCATQPIAPQPAPEPPPETPVREATRVETIKIASLPRGCVVEVNGEYMGITPMVLRVPATPDGRWRGSSNGVYVMRVSTLNNKTGETKYWRGGQHIPSRLLFRPPGAQGTTPVTFQQE